MSLIQGTRNTHVPTMISSSYCNRTSGCLVVLRRGNCGEVVVASLNGSPFPGLPDGSLACDPDEIVEQVGANDKQVGKGSVCCFICVSDGVSDLSVDLADPFPKSMASVRHVSGPPHAVVRLIVCRATQRQQPNVHAVSNSRNQFRF